MGNTVFIKKEELCTLIFPWAIVLPLIRHDEMQRKMAINEMILLMK